MTKSLADFDNDMMSKGWTIFPGILDEKLVMRMRSDSLKWVEVCQGYQVNAGINENGDGTAHHAIGAGDSIDKFVCQHLFHVYLEHFFGNKPYIMHACNPVGGLPQADTYLHRIHRDSATFIPGCNFRINMLVMLDEFTLENGATQILSGSQMMADAPTTEEFSRKFELFVGPPGTVVLFNSYLWHKGGRNATDRSRVALTLSFGPAFVKPQMDYARLLGDEKGDKLSPLSRQILGYNSRVPVNLEEWYRTKSKRLYLSDQG